MDGKFPSIATSFRSSTTLPIFMNVQSKRGLVVQNSEKMPATQRGRANLCVLHSCREAIESFWDPMDLVDLNVSQDSLPHLAEIAVVAVPLQMIPEDMQGSVSRSQ